MDVTVDVRESLQKARQILTRPKEFFKVAVKEKGWKSALGFTIVIGGIGHIMTAIYSLMFFPSLSDTPYNPMQIIAAVTISFVLTVGMSFIWGGALKVWLSIFKVDSTFDKAYRVMVYSRTPNYLLSFLPVVNFVAALYSFYLLMLGLESEYEVSRKRALAIIITSLVAVMAISAVAFSLIAKV